MLHLYTLPSRLKTVNSWIAAGGIARFTLFPYRKDVGKSSSLLLSRYVNSYPVFLAFALKHQRLPVGTCVPSPALCSLDFPPLKKGDLSTSCQNYTIENPNMILNMLKLLMYGYRRFRL